MSKPEGPSVIFHGSLEERLEYALGLFVQGGEASQRGAIFALSAVQSYVHEHAFKDGPEGDRLLRPLDELVVALLERQCGKAHPLLQFDKAPGGSALLISEADFQMLSCFVVDLLEWSGLERDKAFTRVARSLTKSGFYQTRMKAGNLEDITAVTVNGWHRGRDRSYEVGSLKESSDMLEWVQGVCRGLIGPEELSFVGMTPSVARGIADLILERAIPVRFGHLRPGP